MSSDDETEQLPPAGEDDTAITPPPDKPEDNGVDHEHPSEPGTSELGASNPDPPLSKNALRRLRKAERQVAWKAARKLKDKEKKAEKKRKRVEAIANGEPAPEPPRKRPRPAPVEQKKFNARVVVDLGFDDKMVEKDVQSLCNQLSYTYGAQRKAPIMFQHLAFSSLDGQTQKRMDEAFRGSYKNWKGVEWWPDGYEHLWRGEDVADQGAKEGEGERSQPTLLREPKESIVYLTADGEEEISELKEGETYIIGGIVDHNRYKNLCRDKAVEQGIRAARLPIGTFLSELSTRKVLTVNQVFEIMLTWLEKRDWREAFWKQIPKRKFQRRGREDDADGEAEDEDLKDDEGAAEGAGGEGSAPAVPPDASEDIVNSAGTAVETNDAL